MENKEDNSKNIEILVTEKDSGVRLDSFLAKEIEDSSRNFLQKLVERGNVLIDDSVCTSKKTKIKSGQNINIIIPEPVELKIEAEDIPLEIIYEDDDVLVVNKPKGMVVHPAVGNYTGTLVNAIMYHCGERLSSINGVIRPGIVHRIDKDTSGLLMIAKNDMAHESLSRQLAKHSTKRTYQALVYDNIIKEEGVVNKPLGRDPKNRLRQAVVSENGKNAITHYKVLERFGKYTLIEANLETGRTHQIRVHMAYIKHPLVGDEVYGPIDTKFNTNGQMLHAKTLGFLHPRTSEYMEFNSELPDYFKDILNKLRERK